MVCGQVNFWYALSRGKLLLQKNPRTLHVHYISEIQTFLDVYVQYIYQGFLYIFLSQKFNNNEKKQLLCGTYDSMIYCQLFKAVSSLKLYFRAILLFFKM